MTLNSCSRPRFLAGTLIIAGMATACNREDLSPTGALAATISPIGSVSMVTATAADGRTYSAVPDARTGVFSFSALPTGSYTLSFAQLPPYQTPGKVAVTVAAGTTTTPVLSPISHDGVLRGTMRWTLRDTTYTANVLNGQLSEKYVFLTGLYTPSIGGPDQYLKAREVSIVLPDQGTQGAIFHGVGTYPFGSSEFPFARYRYFAAGASGPAADYTTNAQPAATPVGTVTLTRFDAQAGIITGTVEFTADARSGASGRAAVTRGSFDLTF